MPSEMKRILSIDGGGIRGLIPALVLAEIERRTKKTVHELFDLIAGTSTGGILALGLTIPDEKGKPKYSAAQLADLYVEEGDTIFARSIWHRMRAVGSLLEEKYPSKGIEQTLGAYFGEARLDQALTEVMVTSYDIERRRPYFFKSTRARESEDRNLLMRQAARATSAAPTFFEPCLIQTTGVDRLVLVDGGVFANNPTMCAWAEAMKIFHKPAQVLVVSLGTGELTRPYYYEDAEGWGLAGWARPVLDIMFDGVSDATDHQMRQLLPGSDPQTYYRFQTRLIEGNDEMDDAGPTNLRVLVHLAEDLISNNQSELERLCKQLLER